MEVARIDAAGWAVATVMAGATLAGCGGGNNASPTDSSSAARSMSSSVSSPSPGQPMDYSALLIKPADIGGDLTAPQPPVLNPNNAPGVAQLFASADHSRRIGDSILIVADPATAAAGIDRTRANYGGTVNGTWQPIDVGSNGTIISGTSPDTAQSVTVLLFSEGRALVNLEFHSAPGDPINPAAAVDIGRKQDAAIKKALPG
ncbi:hypothetical protein A5756_00795 [Mycobacterium sp. 852002-53434_SCH5985345]|uniref:hypothetical protein n=1 Tax=Mycobacterium sp. 852002-53434_SCH5985345 TaxID=1834107 RepID=UPI0008000BF5|nr:hypothetical protein [Mycobacterium sp. 852002-53434_SCH5985345]OBF50133.1 hypothetical protein A5756_00795 [Mycobacterium sp. 852002-53434_SCH5985345]